MTVASARGAAIGDSLARLLEFAGNEVEREYYINDYGTQVRLFGESIRARARGEEPPEGGYQGEYIAELAAEIDGAAERDAEDLAREGVERMMRRVEATLARFRVHFDRFFSERSLYEGGAVERVVRAAGRARVRPRGGALAADLRAGRREGQRAGPVVGRADLLRLRHRLPRGQARARLRPRDQHLGRRPPRPRQADAGGVAGAGRRGGGARAPDHAARQPDGGRSARADVEAPGRVRHARRPDRRHRRGRGALLPAPALARHDDRPRPRAGARAVEREPRLLLPVRPRADRLDPAARGGASRMPPRPPSCTPPSRS